MCEQNDTTDGIGWPSAYIADQLHTPATAPAALLAPALRLMQPKQHSTAGYSAEA